MHPGNTANVLWGAGIKVPEDLTGLLDRWVGVRARFLTDTLIEKRNNAFLNGDKALPASLLDAGQLLYLMASFSP
eukprot:1153010-Pelagomonas_calceolata.AAC.2